MKLFIISINGKVEDKGYTSLKWACNHAGVSYSTAIYGKRIFTKGDNVVIITEIEVVKIKGREHNAKFTK